MKTIPDSSRNMIAEKSTMAKPPASYSARRHLFLSRERDAFSFSSEA
jgi:hypothetical protein